MQRFLRVLREFSCSEFSIGAKLISLQISIIKFTKIFPPFLMKIFLDKFLIT